MSKFVQFLTFSNGFGPEMHMHLVPVEDVETIREVTARFGGDQDCSVGQTKDNLAIEKALEKYKSVRLMGAFDVVNDEHTEMPKHDITLPEGHSIVKIVTRNVVQ